MTVSSTISSTGAMPGDGQNNRWPFDFAVTSAAQVEVILRTAGGASLALPASDYTVALVDDGRRGGTVTYPTGSGRLADDEALVIRRKPRFVQERDLANQGRYSPEAIEAALDELTFDDQHLLDEIQRAMRLPHGTPVEQATPVPVHDGFLKASLLSSGAWRLGWTTVAPGAAPGGLKGELRFRFADDLELKGDGTPEVDAINTALLDLSEAGGGTVILTAAAGYWPIDKQLKVRSNVQLIWGSPQRHGRDGSQAMVGNYARELATATVKTAAAAGATLVAVDVEIAGGGQVSTFLAVNDQIELGGGDRRRITAVDDTGSGASSGTITLDAALSKALAVGAEVRKLVVSYLTADIALHATPTEVPVANPERFDLYDVVWIVDDETAADVGGGTTDLINSELALVIGFGAGTIRLDRPVRHGFTTAKRARVVKIEPCRNASISGVNISFTEAPDADRVDVVQMSLCYQCAIFSGAIYNEDDYGTRGQAFRLYRSLECELADCYVGPSKYKDAGEGYAFSVRESTGCKLKRLTGVGVRHVLSFSTATDCYANEIRGRLWTSNLIDFHGLREIGCLVEGVFGIGGGVTAQGGICFGNPTWPAGALECKVLGGLISDLDGSSAKGIQIWPGSDGCEVEGVTFRRVNWGIFAEDVAGLPGAMIGAVRVACRFEQVWQCVKIWMDLKNADGGRRMIELDLSDSEFLQFEKGIFARDMERFTAEGVSMRTTVHEAGGYAIELHRILSPTIERGRFRGCQKVLKFGDCAPHLLHAIVTDAGTATVLQEASQAPADSWLDAYGTYIGFTPARSTTSAGQVLSLPGMS